MILAKDTLTLHSLTCWGVHFFMLSFKGGGLLMVPQDRFDSWYQKWGMGFWITRYFFFVQDKIFFFNSTIACWKIHIRKSFVTLETLPLKTKASLASHLWKLKKNIHFHKSLIKTRFYSTTLVPALKIFWFEMPFVCAVTKAVWGTINNPPPHCTTKCEASMCSLQGSYPNESCL